MNIRSVIFLLILSTSTTLAQTFSDYDTKVDFTKYTTYAWLAPGDSVLNRPRTDKAFGGYIMHFANLELQKRGMRIDTLRPQTLILFDSKVADEIRYSQSATLSVGVGVAGPGYYVGGSAPVAGGKITANPYQQGALVFEMIDAQTGKVLWRGGTKKEFKTNPDVPRLIQEAEGKIFRKFPRRK